MMCFLHLVLTSKSELIYFKKENLRLCDNAASNNHYRWHLDTVCYMLYKNETF